MWQVGGCMSNLPIMTRMRKLLAGITAVFVLSAAASPKFEAAAQQGWIAIQTEARGITFEIPRDYLHLRGSDGTFELGVNIESFRPLGLLGISGQTFRNQGSRFRVELSSPFTGTASVQNALRFGRDIGQVQTQRTAELLDDTADLRVPQGLVYYPGRFLPNATDVTLRRIRTRDLFLLHEPAGFDPRSNEGLPEHIECAVQYEERRENDPVYCEWYWVFRGLFVRWTLDRYHLYRWRELRSKMQALLDSFVVNDRDWALPPPTGTNRSVAGSKLIYEGSR